MKNYNDITIMSLGFFLSDQGVLEWFLSELMGRQIRLARRPETAMPWEEVALTPDIRAVSEDQEDIYLLSIGRCGFKEDAMWELKASTCDEFQSEGRVHNILITPGKMGWSAALRRGMGSGSSTPSFLLTATAHALTNPHSISGSCWTSCAAGMRSCGWMKNRSRQSWPKVHTSPIGQTSSAGGRKWSMRRHISRPSNQDNPLLQPR